MLDILSPNGFEFWVPLTLEKSQDKTKDGKRWIEGIASTENLDLQNEIVLQSGIDTSYFLKHGYFNNDHKPGFENKVGQPTECKITKKGLWVKGYLFKNHKVADAIWELANSLEASGSTRKLGFSIQGKVLRRRGKTIVKCWIQDVAITAAPINTNTWLDVVKSLDALPPDIWCDDTGCYVITPDIAHKSVKASEGRCCGACNCTGGGNDQEKSIRPCDMDLIKQEKESDDKALQAGGSVLVPESLEGDVKDQNWGDVENTSKARKEIEAFLQKNPEPEDEQIHALAEKLGIDKHEFEEEIYRMLAEKINSKHEDTKKSMVPDDQLSFEESVTLLQAYKGFTQPEARIVAKAVFHMNGL